MKYSLTATASVLTILLSFVIASPIDDSNVPRDIIEAGHCPFGDANRLFSIVSETDPNRKLRWDLYQKAGGGIEQNELALYSEDHPDDPATFAFTPADSSGINFYIERHYDQLQVAANNGGFSGQSSGMALEIHCVACPRGSLFAEGCLIRVPIKQAPPGQSENRQCATSNGGSNSPVILQDCDMTQYTNQVQNGTQLFSIFQA